MNDMKLSTFLRLALAACVSPRFATAKEAGKPRKLVLIAGKPSHPPMMHEFRAGTILLEKRLREVPGIVVDRHEKDWVSDEKTFDDADAVVRNPERPLRRTRPRQWNCGVFFEVRATMGLFKRDVTSFKPRKASAKRRP